MQLLESDTSKHYVTWTRWGRVGVAGQNSVVAEGSLDACKAAFCKKFRDKTHNGWENRSVGFGLVFLCARPVPRACLTVLTVPRPTVTASPTSRASTTW